MNDDVCPPGTMSLLQHLGYVIRDGRWHPQSEQDPTFTPLADRLNRHKELLLLGVPHDESWQASLTEELFEAAKNRDNYSKNYSDSITAAMKPAEDEGKEIPGGSYSGILFESNPGQDSHFKRIFDAAELQARPLMNVCGGEDFSATWDYGEGAEPMSEEEIAHRCREAKMYHEHGCWRDRL